MRAKLAALVLVLCAFWSSPAYAWDELGHRVVARIAWDNMTPAARARAVALLRAAPPRSGLAELRPATGTDEERDREWFIWAAVWPDLIRDRNAPNYVYGHADWHYVNFFWEQGADGRPRDRDDVPRAGFLLDQLQRISGTLGSAAVPDSAQAVDLAWALHLVGDVHQPLHNNARITARDTAGDRGGNSFRLAGVYPFNNLHSFWDGLVGMNEPWALADRSEADYVGTVAARLERAYPAPSLRGQMRAGAFETWSREGLRVAQARAYPSWLVRDQAAPPRYRPFAWEGAEPRVAMAGYRLADMLNARLGA